MILTILASLAIGALCILGGVAILGAVLVALYREAIGESLWK